jgi:hypothetical protein
VVERDPRRASGRLLRDDGMEASYVDLADPAHLEFDYLRWLRIVLRASRAGRVIHVGGGACALARALAAEDPGGRQEVCEVNAEVIALARAHLGLRRKPGLHVRHAEGRAFIATQPDASWDAVVIDAFIAAGVPHRLVTVEAVTGAAERRPDRRARRGRSVTGESNDTAEACVPDRDDAAPARRRGLKPVVLYSSPRPTRRLIPSAH